jgi:hypothetical protein
LMLPPETLPNFGNHLGQRSSLIRCLRISETTQTMPKAPWDCVVNARSSPKKMTKGLTMDP